MRAAKPIISKLKNNSFLKHNAVFFFGALLVSALNYLYYPVLGRLLDLSAYGEVQVLVSLFLQLTIFMTVLGQVTVNVVANSQSDNRQRIVFELQKLGLLLSIATFFIGVIVSGWVAQLLKLESPLPFIMLLVAPIFTVPVTFQTSVLRGNKQFAAVSLSNIIGAAGKILCSVLFILLGWSASGAIGGIVAAQILAWLYALKVVRRSQQTTETTENYFSLPNFRLIRSELKFAGFVFVASLGVTVLSSIDTVLAKMFFDPEVAGRYAGIATVAKIIFFLTASIAQVLIPSVKMQAPKKENRQLLIKSFGLVMLLGGAACAAFVMLPDFIVSILMGANFAPYAHLLPLLALAMLVVSLINLIVSYYIALRKYAISGIVIAGVVVTAGLLFASHDTVDTVALNLFYGAALMLGMFVLWRLKNYLIERKSV